MDAMGEEIIVATKKIITKKNKASPPTRTADDPPTDKQLTYMKGLKRKYKVVPPVKAYVSKSAACVWIDSIVSKYEAPR